MAIIFPQGFEVASKESIDNRFLLTKSEMAQLLKGEMPDKYFCICKDDGKFYIYDSTFEKSDTLGRFKSYDELIDVPAALQSAIEHSLEALTEKIAVVLPGALKTALEEQSVDSGLAVDDDGNISLQVNEEQMELINNKLNLSFEVIQAI